jgi:hypothetical protein
MWTNLIESGVDFALALVSVLVLVFLLNRLGLILWFSWLSRRKNKNEDSAAKTYWNVHE